MKNVKVLVLNKFSTISDLEEFKNQTNSAGVDDKCSADNFRKLFDL